MISHRKKLSLVTALKTNLLPDLHIQYMYINTLPSIQKAKKAAVLSSHETDIKEQVTDAATYKLLVNKFKTEEQCLRMGRTRVINDWSMRDSH